MGWNTWSEFEEECKEADKHLAPILRRKPSQMLVEYKSIPSGSDQMKRLEDKVTKRDGRIIRNASDLKTDIKRRLQLIQNELQKISVLDDSSFLLVQKTPSLVPLAADTFASCKY